MANSPSPIKILSGHLCPWLKTYLASLNIAREENRLAHGWLLAGPRGIGKINLALVIAEQLLHPSGKLPATLDSANAISAMKERHEPCDHHQDLHWVFPEEGKQRILIDPIRELIDDLNLTSHSGQTKVAIIEPAEAMNKNAASALLKTLEEPTADTYFLLVTHHPTQLPVTIRSRCQLLPISCPSAEEALSWLCSGREEKRAEYSFLLASSRGAPLAKTSEECVKYININSELEDILILISQDKIGAYDETVAERFFSNDKILALDWLSARLEGAIRARFLASDYDQFKESGFQPLLEAWEGISTKKLFLQLGALEQLTIQISTGVKINTDLALGLLLQGFHPTNK